MKSETSFLQTSENPGMEEGEEGGDVLTPWGVDGVWAEGGRVGAPDMGEGEATACRSQRRAGSHSVGTQEWPRGSACGTRVAAQRRHQTFNNKLKQGRKVLSEKKRDT